MSLRIWKKNLNRLKITYLNKPNRLAICIVCDCITVIPDGKYIPDDIGTNKAAGPKYKNGAFQLFNFYLKLFVIDHERLKIRVYDLQYIAFVQSTQLLMVTLTAIEATGIPFRV